MYLQRVHMLRLNQFVQYLITGVLICTNCEYVMCIGLEFSIYLTNFGNFVQGQVFYMDRSFGQEYENFVFLSINISNLYEYKCSIFSVKLKVYTTLPTARYKCNSINYLEKLLDVFYFIFNYLILRVYYKFQGVQFLV